MKVDTLTERQQRERDFYDQFAKQSESCEIVFDPVLGKESRPWNSYWYVYEMARTHFESGCRKLLDFGCGTGAPAVRFAYLGYDVSGFDISAENIAAAEKLAQKYNLQGSIQLSVQAAEHLNYPFGAFDLVVGFDILHHVEIGPSITEAMRVLRKGGVAIFREWIEVPLLDRIRRSRLVRKLVPNTKSYEFHRHITQDERKLDKHNLEVLRQSCPAVEMLRFGVLSRLDRFVRPVGGPDASFLEKCDHRLFRIFPAVRHLGGEAVLILHKR